MLVVLDVIVNIMGVNFYQFWICDVVVDDLDIEEDESLNVVLVIEVDICMIGDILFGLGDDVICIEVGDVFGVIFFGNGDDMLVLDGLDVCDEIVNFLFVGCIDLLMNDELYDVFFSYVGVIVDFNGMLNIDV